MKAGTGNVGKGRTLNTYHVSNPDFSSPVYYGTAIIRTPPVLAVLCSVGLLDVLHEYDCGDLGRKPCQDGACAASLRLAMRNPG